MLVTLTRAGLPCGCDKMLQRFPDLVVELLVQHHLSDLDVKTLRFVSKEWRSLIDAAITRLRPRDFKESQVTQYMPAKPEAVLFHCHHPDRAPWLL